MLQEVKDHLRITWNDEDAHIEGLIEESSAYLYSVTGRKEFDYSKDAQARLLLKERCRYVYNRATADFEPNFRHEIINLQLRVAREERQARLDGSVQ